MAPGIMHFPASAAAVDLSAYYTSAQTDTLLGAKATTTAVAAKADASGYPAKSGQVQMTACLSAVAAATAPSGQCSFMPFDVGPLAGNFNQLLISVSTAIIGGTYVCKVAAYPDDGSCAAPLITGGPIVSGDIDLTATGARGATVSWQPAPGRYWLAFFYYASVAPGTNPQPFCVSAGVALPAATSPGSTSRALILTGLTALPTSGTPAASTLTTCASVGARAA